MTTNNQKPPPDQKEALGFIARLVNIVIPVVALGKHNLYLENVHIFIRVTGFYWKWKIPISKCFSHSIGPLESGFYKAKKKIDSQPS